MGPTLKTLYLSPNCIKLPQPTIHFWGSTTQKFIYEATFLHSTHLRNVCPSFWSVALLWTKTQFWLACQERRLLPKWKKYFLFICHNLSKNILKLKQYRGRTIKVKLNRIRFMRFNGEPKSFLLMILSSLRIIASLNLGLHSFVLWSHLLKILLQNKSHYSCIYC